MIGQQMIARRLLLSICQAVGDDAKQGRTRIAIVPS